MRGETKEKFRTIDLINKRNGFQIQQLTTLVKWRIVNHAAQLLSILLS
jgi:hypothetical protein